MSTHRAKVDIIIGHKLINKFMEAADLQTQAGVKETFIIDYKPGEVVNHDRVRKAMDKTIKDMEDNKDCNFHIISYDNIRIEVVEE